MRLDGGGWRSIPPAIASEKRWGPKESPEVEKLALRQVPGLLAVTQF